MEWGSFNGAILLRNSIQPRLHCALLAMWQLRALEDEKNFKQKRQRWVLDITKDVLWRDILDEHGETAKGIQ
jgi:hypothetical protein